MNRKVTDVHRTLSYSHEKMARRFLLIGVPALFIGVGGLVYGSGGRDTFMSMLGLLAGGFCIGYGFYRTANPGKLLVLSPDGVRLHIDMVKSVLIPWREIHAVERIDPNVTAVLVSQRFYDRFIHVNSFILRGPGWGDLFIPKGDMMQVALHHGMLPVKAEELYAAVEARWTAFRDANRAQGRGSVPSVTSHESGDERA